MQARPTHTHTAMLAIATRARQAIVRLAVIAHERLVAEALARRKRAGR